MFQQASKRAFVSNAYCERKKNHSYPPSQGLRASEFFLTINQKSSASLSGEHQLATPCRATVPGTLAVGEGQAPHSATGANSAHVFGFAVPRVSARAHDSREGGSGSSYRHEGPEEQAVILTGFIWQNKLGKEGGVWGQVWG